MSKPLPQTWDGNTASFPTFIINLRLRAIKAKWHATGTSGILTVDGKNIFTSFHSITKENIELARMNRTNNRAIHTSALKHPFREHSKRPYSLRRKISPNTRMELVYSKPSQISPQCLPFNCPTSPSHKYWTSIQPNWTFRFQISTQNLFISSCWRQQEAGC